MLQALRLMTTVVLVLPASLPAQTHGASAETRAAPVFREPFTLRIKIDRQHYYEEHIEKRIPFVADNDVYLFSGENFGVNLSVDGENVNVTYQPDLKKADVWFTFAQPEHEPDDLQGAMLLTIQNKLKNELHIDAVMTLPQKKDLYQTSILPVPGGLSDFESWPHPIVQLVLRNFRLTENEIKPNR